MGIIYAIAATAGDFQYNESRRFLAQSRPVSAFLEAVRAEAIFPLRYYIRENIGTMFNIADSLPQTLVLEQIDRVLKADPHSPHLLWYKAMQHLREGDLKNAKTTIDHLERVGKGWKQTENAKAVYLAVKKHIEKLRAQRDHSL